MFEILLKYVKDTCEKYKLQYAHSKNQYDETLVTFYIYKQEVLDELHVCFTVNIYTVTYYDFGKLVISAIVMLTHQKPVEWSIK